MDCYRKLCLEFNGIKSLLDHYTSEGPAVSILPSLKEAMERKDKDSIIYCLQVILEWYSSNIDKIKSNIYVDNFKDYERNMKLLSDICDEMQACSFDIFEDDNPKFNCSPMIFLSHKSDDKKYGDALEKFIMGLGVKRDQLIYTSHPLHKIPIDENIYEYLRKNINRDLFMIILWSDKYLESPACLNEMGAAWVVQCDYTNIYVPTFSFGNPKYHECAVDTRKMGAVLNGDAHCKQNMIELKNKIEVLFNLNNDESQVTFLLDTFITEIKEIQTNDQTEI